VYHITQSTMAHDRNLDSFYKTANPNMFLSRQNTKADTADKHA